MSEPITSPLVLYSEDKLVIGAWSDAVEARKRWYEETVDYAQEHWSSQPVVAHFLGHWVLRGLRENRVGVPPDGWKFVKSWSCLRPRRGRAGEDARKWLATSQPPPDPVRVLGAGGLPEYSERPGRSSTVLLMAPHIMLAEGKIYAYWEDGELVTQPTAAWHQIPMSSYWAIREREEGR